MLYHSFKKLFLMLCIGSLISCEPENLQELPVDEVTSDFLLSGKAKNKPRVDIPQAPLTENLREMIFKAVAPSECGATELSEITWKYFTELASDDIAVENMDFYFYLQENAVRFRIGTEYFGKHGAYTQHVRKEQRSLEKFWKMPNQIEVLGQHNETLKDRDKIAKILYYNLMDEGTWEQVYESADELIARSKNSPALPDSPFFAADGYANFNKQIVLGDGLIKMFSETGIDEEIVWTGILAHEWSHQVQFDHFAAWYPQDLFASKAEETRAIELEADFFSGYYMTHKRGATYNWKRAEEFFEVFYQAGDCSFSFEQHHGTPLQRKRASYQGYLLAKGAQKQGHILSAEELHEIFMEKVLPETVSELQYL